MDAVSRIPESYPSIDIPVGATLDDVNNLITESGWPHGYWVLPIGGDPDPTAEFFIMIQVPWQRADQWMAVGVKPGRWFGVIPTDTKVGDLRDVRLVTWDTSQPPRPQLYPLPPGYRWNLDDSIEQENDD